MSTAACDGSDLCDELRGQPSGTEFERTYGGHPRSRVVHSTESFALIVDLSPVVPGHLLIATRAHLLSFGQLDDRRHAEFEGLLSRVLPMFEREYGPWLLMEHGSSSDASEGACVRHAHVHLVPHHSGVVTAAIGDGCRQVGDSRSRLVELAARDKQYFHLRTSSTALLLTSGVPRRQYARRLLAEANGLHDPLWDWTITNHENFLVTYRVSRRLFAMQGVSR